MADVSVEARERMKTEHIREDRTVEGWYIETHYTPCKGIADANGYLRVLVDEEGYDTETRILHETLNGIGWVKSAALSANNQERAEAVPIAYLKAQTSSLEEIHNVAIDPRDPNAIPVVAATPHPPTAEPVDPAYPFYELKFIMRVLSHKGGAPKQDWDTAYGMAREIFVRWHKDRQDAAEGQTKQGRAADGVVSDEQVDAAMEGFHFTATGLPRRADMRCALEQFAATQPPSASPVAVPLIARSLAEWHEDDGPVLWWAWCGKQTGWAGEPAWIGTPNDSDWPGYHTHWTAHPALPDAGLNSQKDAS